LKHCNGRAKSGAVKPGFTENEVFSHMADSIKKPTIQNLQEYYEGIMKRVLKKRRSLSLSFLRILFV
jgi:hypothetical protein